MNLLRKNGIWLFAILLIGVVFSSVNYLKPKYSFNWDSHNKLVQSYSLLQNKFQSEELFYPGKKFDPDYKYFPVQNNVFLKLDQRHLSAFPVFFAAISSLWLWVFGFSALPYLSAIGLLLSLLLLYEKWKFSKLSLAIAGLGTFAWILSIEYSEHSFFMFSTLCSLTFALRGKNSLVKFIFSGIFCGISVWFRHEGLVYCASLAFWILFAGNKKGSFKKSISEFLFFSLGAAISVGIFFLFNFIDYGHFLGPRFLINESGLNVSYMTRLEWAKTLLFFGTFKLGYFGYMPASLLLFPILIAGWKKLSPKNRILLGSTLSYIFLVLLIIPNDGFNNWGPRFFGPAVFPFAILFSKYYYFLKKRRKFKFIRILFLICILFSFTCGLIGLKYLKEGRKQQEANNLALHSTNSEIWIFSDDSLAYIAGSDYFNKIIFRVYLAEDLPQFLSDLSKFYPGKKITLIQANDEIFGEKVKSTIKENSKFAYGIGKMIWEKESFESAVRSNLDNREELAKASLKFSIGNLKLR
ncbi:LA_3751/LA_3752 family putative glycosyltransferase [Leptospira andrefontaineae]|uniref:Glycosyltransferase RgtA/B/C/D-like domain-containing protein n=1 Tax=Leptospira andrefontaineae TaxID=2484976 RepID=A0A4R9HAT6_9LEPT|nr:hypothetical protein [Leptospira andrefontaineae]TGK43657.1 hypothetical protein EHO65_03185 [Leptospira andrefontaineae]